MILPQRLMGRSLLTVCLIRVPFYSRIRTALPLHTARAFSSRRNVRVQNQAGRNSGHRRKKHKDEEEVDGGPTISRIRRSVPSNRNPKAALGGRKDAQFFDPTLLLPREELPAWVVDGPLPGSIRLAKSLVTKIATSTLESFEKVERVAENKSRITSYSGSLRATVGDVEYEVTAEAATKDHATHVAWLHLLSKLRAAGEPSLALELDGLSAEERRLSLTLPSPITSEQEGIPTASRDSLSAASDLSPTLRDLSKASEGRSFAPEVLSPTVEDGFYGTLLDVYMYCARVGALPAISLRKDAGTELFIYTIDLEAQGISVFGVHKTAIHAHKIALLAFKKAVLQYATKKGKGSQPRADSYRIGTHQDAANFLEWLSKRRTIRVEVRDAAHVSKGPDTGLLGVIAKYTILTGEADPKVALTPVMLGSSQAEEHEAAIFHTALDVVRRYPKWLTKYASAIQPEEQTRQPGTNVKANNDMTALMETGVPGDSSKFAKQTELDISYASYLLMEAVPDLPDTAEEKTAGSDELNQRRERWFPLIGRAKEYHSRYLNEAYCSYPSDAPPAIRTARASLPVVFYRSKLLQLVDNNVYSILIGATGSGKTTQVPQLILEDWCLRGHGSDCSIICTQPRVIAATSVASRVADELGPRLRSRVGHHVRNNTQVPRPRDGSITFCTTGILLQQLQNAPDLIMDNISHLILDEVHERDLVLDLTLAVLKQVVARRLERGLKVPRILLMSATLDTEVFVNHFQNIGAQGELTPAPSLSVPGRLFPVREKYLDEVLSEMNRLHDRRELRVLRNTWEYQKSTMYIEQELRPVVRGSTTAPAKAQNHASHWDPAKELTTPIGLVAETIAHVLSTTSKGAVLVFLPGLGEINKVEKLLMSLNWQIFGIDFRRAEKYRFLKLHSSLPDSQKAVFQPIPAGARKIILSSPVAETSVTIPDVTTVIDSGQVRELQYDQAIRATWLRNCWINGSSAKQRAGRAGRVESGTYLALYSKARRDAMPAAGVPEIMRADLQSTCLTVKSIIKDANVPEFLAAAIDPPKKEHVQDAMELLVDTGALTSDRKLTPLGRLLCDIPIHPSLAKMIVMGIIFRCLDPIIIAGAAIEQQDLWVTKLETRKKALESKTAFAQNSQSDLIATYNAFCYMRSSPLPAYLAAEEKFLNLSVFSRIKEAAVALRDTLVGDGLLQQQDAGRIEEQLGGHAFNVNSHNQNVIKAVLLAGLQGNIGRSTKVSRKVKFSLGDRPNAVPGPSSIFGTNEARASNKNMGLIAFGQLALSHDTFIVRDVTAISPMMAALFGGSLTIQPGSSACRFLVNGFLPLNISMRSVYGAINPSKNKAWEVVWQFRKALDQALGIAFDNLARRRRGISAAPVDDVVAKFVERVIQVLDTEALAEEAPESTAALALQLQDRRGKRQGKTKGKGAVQEARLRASLQSKNLGSATQTRIQNAAVEAIAARASVKKEHRRTARESDQKTAAAVTQIMDWFTQNQDEGSRGVTRQPLK